MPATPPLHPGDEGYAPAEPVIRPAADPNTPKTRSRLNWRANGAVNWARSRRGDGWTYTQIAVALGVPYKCVTNVLIVRAARPHGAARSIATLSPAAAACARHLQALRRHGAEGAVPDPDQRRRRTLAAPHPPPKTFTIDMRHAPGRSLSADLNAFGAEE